MSGELRVSDYLANERTFLAWIRTRMAVMNLGFVVAKFSLWLRLPGTRVHRRRRFAPRACRFRLAWA